MKYVASIMLAFLILTATSAVAQNQQRQANNAFNNWDANGDGQVSREEFPSRLTADVFKRVDTNGDGFISRQEDTAFRNRRRGQGTANQEKRSTRTGQQLPDGIELTANITYATIDDRELKLDLYAPKVKPDKPMPVVMWIHGGGWKGGSKNNPRRALPILDRGYIVVSVEYRLSGEAIFPAAIADCKAAVRWVRANAKTYGMDPDRIGVWGSSAGGHLVALLGTAGDVKQWDAIHEENAKYSSRPNAVCDWFGPTDFQRMNDFPSKIDHNGADSPESRFIGAPIQTVPEKTQLANPIKYISAKTPPFLIMHGDKDMSVCYNQSELLHAALVKAGVPSTLYKVVGGGHGFRDAKNDTPESLFKMSADFFDKQFKDQPKRNPRQRTRNRKPAVSAATLKLYEPGEFKGLKYRLMKPIDFDPAKTYPLVLSLHGAGGRGSDNIQNLRNWNELMAAEELRRKHPAFVLAPQTQVRWSDPTSPFAKEPEITDELLNKLPEDMKKRIRTRRDQQTEAPAGDLGSVLELVDTVLMKQFPIDADRVYCIGHSMGGAGTFTAIYQHPDRFAAAIPTAGGFGPTRDVNRIKDVPIWAFHGDNDNVVAYAFTKHVFNRLKAIDGNMKFTTLKGVKHGASMPAFSYTGDDPAKGFKTEYASDRPDKTSDVWEWLFKQKRN